MIVFIILISLIGLLKEDEKEGVKEILKKYMPDLIRFLRVKLCGNNELTEEIFQETALAFVKAVSDKKVFFLSDDKVKSFLFTVAMNNFRNYYKKNMNTMKKQKFFKTEDEMNECLEKIIQKEKSPEEEALYNEEKTYINNIVSIVMSTLSSSYQEILKLKFTDEKSNIEIAEQLNISVKAVESLLFRAKQSFKKQFNIISLKEDKLLNERREKDE